MEDFLEDIGAEVEINTDDQYQFFPIVFPIGLWGIRYSLFVIYSCPSVNRLNSGRPGRASAKNSWATEMAYAEYIVEITENRLHTGSEISIDVFSNFRL